MIPALPLDEMSTPDKLALMEQLWEALCRTPDDVVSPSWHGEILSEREKRVREGKAKFSDLVEVEDRLRKMTR